MRKRNAYIFEAVASGLGTMFFQGMSVIALQKAFLEGWYFLVMIALEALVILLFVIFVISVAAAAKSYLISEMNRKEKEQVICKNCGRSFSVDFKKCPYCSELALVQGETKEGIVPENEL